MSVLLLMPRKRRPGLVVVSDSYGPLALIPPEAARAGGFRVYLIDRVGAETAVDYMDGRKVIRLSSRDWQTAVPVTVEQIVRTAELRCQGWIHAADPPPVGGEGHSDSGGGP